MADEDEEALERERLLQRLIAAQSESKAKPTKPSILNRLKKKEEQIVKPAVHQKSMVTYFHEKPDTDPGCMKFYYPTLEEFVRLNFPCGKRPWLISGPNPQNLTGREAFDDAMLYRPGDMYKYIQDWYVDYFKGQGVASPFAFPKDNIFRSVEQICDSRVFTLQPHQKFVATYMSNQTDAPSVLVCHKIGAEKVSQAC